MKKGFFKHFLLRGWVLTNVETKSMPLANHICRRCRMLEESRTQGGFWFCEAQIRPHAINQGQCTLKQTFLIHCMCLLVSLVFIPCASIFSDCYTFSLSVHLNIVQFNPICRASIPRKACLNKNLIRQDYLKHTHIHTFSFYINSPDHNLFGS